MKVSRILRKLNKSYSVVIIPNTNDNVKKLSFTAPFAKLLITMLVLIVATALVFTYNLQNNKNNIQNEEKPISTAELEQKIAALTGVIQQQNQVMAINSSQLVELQNENSKAKAKVDEFTRLYADVAENYISKTSRGAAANKSTSNALMDLTKLSAIVQELNSTFSIDQGLSQQLHETNEKLENCIAAIPAFIPANGTITSPFGMRKHPIKKVYKNHEGVDISSDKGDPIYASASGIVEFAGYSRGYGYYIKIDHQNGFKTIYAHSSKLLVKKGETVKKGQKIALVGSTGTSTGPHLHFEIRIGNAPVDPTEYVAFGNLK